MLKNLTKKYLNDLYNNLNNFDAKEFFHPHEFTKEKIKNLIHEKGNNYYCFFNNKKEFIGYGFLRTFNKYSIPTLGCVIWKKYRGKGHGKNLVKEIINQAKKKKFKKIRLHVHKENIVSLHIYECLGFKTIDKNDKQFFMELEIQ